MEGRIFVDVVLDRRFRGGHAWIQPVHILRKCPRWVVPGILQCFLLITALAYWLKESSSTFSAWLGFFFFSFFKIILFLIISTVKQQGSWTTGVLDGYIFVLLIFVVLLGGGKTFSTWRCTFQIKYALFILHQCWFSILSSLKKDAYCH